MEPPLNRAALFFYRQLLLNFAQAKPIAIPIS